MARLLMAALAIAAMTACLTGCHHDDTPAAGASTTPAPAKGGNTAGGAVPTRADGAPDLKFGQKVPGG
jgi:hypothetical protein